MNTACTASLTAAVKCFSDIIINPLLLLLFAGGFLVFLWGIVEFIWDLGGHADHKEQGKQHMLWGLVGMFVMVAAWAMIQLIANTVCQGGVGGCIPR